MSQIPDVPSQYKELTDKVVLDLIDTAKKIIPVLEELSTDRIEIDGEGFTVTVKKEN